MYIYMHSYAYMISRLKYLRVYPKGSRGSGAEGTAAIDGYASLDAPSLGSLPDR
jgi:hypothetical protein